MTGAGEYVEVQGTAEHTPFHRQGLDALLALAESGIKRLVDLQRSAIGARGERVFVLGGSGCPPTPPAPRAG
jgi:ribonuclease PH